MTSTFDKLELEELKVESPRDDRDAATTTTQRNRTKKKEVYKFETDWLVSNVCWSNGGGRGRHTTRLALTSFIEEYKNFVQVVELPRDEPDQELASVLIFEHPYPATRIQWAPTSQQQQHQLLATTADYLRLWRVGDNEAKLECLLNSNQGSKLCAPLTSFDWCPDASTIVTASVDTTCAVWDLNTSTLVAGCGGDPSGQLRTQLVAHENHVYDVAWCAQGSGKDVIATSSADGSVRLFDLRNLSTSTVLYESSRDARHRNKKAPGAALVRVACSKLESHLVATFACDSSELLVLDTRRPGQPLCVLNRHLGAINSMAWSAQSAGTICSGANDRQVLIWRIQEQHHSASNNNTEPQQASSEPLLTYRAGGRINAANWAPSNVWVAIGYGNCLELLRV